MGAGIEITELTFNDGSRIDCEGYDVILIVGPNNSGKTRSLIDLRNHLDAGAQRLMPQSIIVTGLKTVRRGTSEEAWAIIRSMGERIPPGQDEQYQVPLPAYGQRVAARMGITKKDIAKWPNDAGGQPIDRIFAAYLGPEARHAMSDALSSIDFGRELRSHPLHHLHQDRQLRKKLADGFRKAFGQEVALDLNAGNILPLHVGEHAYPKEGESEYDPHYRDRLRSYPRIDEQGHGMRSFAGILLHCWASYAKLVLIDEPEAFLHPPQARLLARLLAEQHEPGRQLIVATHSTDIVRGILESGVRAKVIRLRRQGSQNIVRELSHEDIGEVWADPVLRYSNILDGLVYERVVVCEADGDCRFYQAIADAMREAEDHGYARDVMFTQAGGKGGIAKLVRALRKLDVPVVVASFILSR